MSNTSDWWQEPIDLGNNQNQPDNWRTCNSGSKGRDNGYNDCGSKMLLKCNRHSTTAAMTPVLARASNRERLNIVGHGTNGFFETGAGQKGSGDPKTNIVFGGNKQYWEVPFKQLPSGASYETYIFACNTGAGEEGADLLFELAKTTGRKVRGCNGLVLCNSKWPPDPKYGLFLEKNAVWVIATPTQRPTPVDPPLVAMDHDSNSTALEITLNETPQLVPVTSLVELKIERIDFLGGASTTRVLDTAETQKLASRLFGTKAQRLPGHLGAMVTAEIDLTIDHPDFGGTYSFVLMNDRMLLDKTEQFGCFVAHDLSSFL